MRVLNSSAGEWLETVCITERVGARVERNWRTEDSLLEELVTALKKVTDKPVAVGFGISKGEQAQQVVNWGADGVIVGSALVKALGEAETPEVGARAGEGGMGRGRGGLTAGCCMRRAYSSPHRKNCFGFQVYMLSRGSKLLKNLMVQLFTAPFFQTG